MNGADHAELRRRARCIEGRLTRLLARRREGDPNDVYLHAPASAQRTVQRYVRLWKRALALHWAGTPEVIRAFLDETRKEFRR